MTAFKQNTQKVGEDEKDMRLDRWFQAHFPNLTHGHLQKLLRTGQVRVDGKRVAANYRIDVGEEVRIPPNVSKETETKRPMEQPAKKPLFSQKDIADLQARILYKDDWVMAINKPAGLAVQGGSKQARNLDAMLDSLVFDAKERPRLVHRLDRDTSGVLILARTREAARLLAQSFKDDEPKKLYWAIVAGRPDHKYGEIDLPLAKRMGAGGEKVFVDRFGKAAKSLYGTVASRKDALSFLVLRPFTGRTHQLRVHAAACGWPIVGDGKYGGKQSFPDAKGLGKNLFLHAREISLPHPEDGTTLRIEADLPKSWNAALVLLHTPDILEKAMRVGDELEQAKE